MNGAPLLVFAEPSISQNIIFATKGNILDYCFKMKQLLSGNVLSIYAVCKHELPPVEVNSSTEGCEEFSIGVKTSEYLLPGRG